MKRTGGGAQRLLAVEPTTFVRFHRAENQSEPLMFFITFITTGLSHTCTSHNTHDALRAHTSSFTVTFPQKLFITHNPLGLAQISWCSRTFQLFLHVFITFSLSVTTVTGEKQP